jgi:ankyrin repeat protein
MIITKGADIDACSGSTTGSPLYIAIKHERTRIAELLLAHDADPNTTGDWSNETPLHLAARKGNVESCKILIAGGAEVDIKDRGGLTPLHEAALYDKIDVAKLLVTNGANIRSKNKDGVTPLICALRGSERSNLVEFLIAQGADIDATADEKAEMLFLASSRGLTDLVERLITNGADVNSKYPTKVAHYPSTVHQDTPLLEALRNGSIGVAKLLIAEGADVNARDSYGQLPLLLALRGKTINEFRRSIHKWDDFEALDQDEQMQYDAVCEGFREIVKQLVLRGADLSIRNEMGETPLHIVVNKDDKEMTELLIARGAEVNVRDLSGTTPLHCAACGHRDILRVLLANGANINAKDNGGNTPLHGAALRGLKEIVELLLAHRADVSLRDNLGHTPLDEAARRGHDDIVALLQTRTTSADPTDANVQNEMELKK